METFVARITFGYVCIIVTVCTVARTFVVLLNVIELCNGLIYKDLSLAREDIGFLSLMFPPRPFFIIPAGSDPFYLDPNEYITSLIRTK